MTKFTNMAIAFILFVTGVSAFITLSDSLDETYQPQTNFTQDKKILDNSLNGANATLMEHLGNMSVIRTINNITSEIQGTETGNGQGNFITELLGLIEIAGIGTAKLVLGLIVFPGQILSILETFYGDVINFGLLKTLVTIIAVIIAFVILSIFIKKDV